jgi:hypothetical protein
MDKELSPEGGVDGLVNPLWVEDEADGEQHEHLVRLLVDLVVLVGLRLRGGVTTITVRKLAR